jgi:hypothetical protein
MNELDFIEALRGPEGDSPRALFQKLAEMKCKNCVNPATKVLMWAEHRAYIPSCDGCVEKLIKKNPQCWTPEDGNRPESIKPASYITDKKKKKKTAGVQEMLKSRLPEIGAGLLGAAAVGTGQYLMNRRRKGGTQPSLEQVQTRAFNEQAQVLRRQAAAENRPLTYKERMLLEVDSRANRVADIMADHPVKGALVAAPMGAYLGVKLLNMVR